MKLNEIQDLIKFVSKSGVSEVELETKEIKIVIRTPKTAAQQVLVQSAPVITTPVAHIAQPVANPVSVPVTESKTPTSNQSGSKDESKYVTIKSPMIGT